MAGAEAAGSVSDDAFKAGGQRFYTPMVNGRQAAWASDAFNPDLSKQSAALRQHI